MDAESNMRRVLRKSNRLASFRKGWSAGDGAFQAVVLDLLGLGYGVRFQASGRSMHPTVNEGERITVEPVDPSRVRKGDIVLYRSAKGFVAHRVVGIEKDCEGEPLFVLRADASQASDESVRAGQILGRVVSTERSGRRINLACRRARLYHALRGKARRIKGWVYGKTTPAADRDKDGSGSRAPRR